MLQEVKQCPSMLKAPFQRLFNWKTDRDAGVKILADRMDQEMDGIAAAINDVTGGGGRFPCSCPQA